MAKKTISQALKDLFLGLGGDASALADNTSASDYIQDLESAIKATASGASEDLIDDTEASSTKTYSSTKIESLIPANELPTPAVADIGKVVSVVSDGNEGAEYELENFPIEVPMREATVSGTTITITPLNNETYMDLLNLFTEKGGYLKVVRKSGTGAVESEALLRYASVKRKISTYGMSDPIVMVFSGVEVSRSGYTTNYSIDYKVATFEYTNDLTGTITAYNLFT